jgi:hypothetical protein
VRRHAATAVVLALLVGTAVAFAETERLKLKPTPIEESFVQPAFSPVCSCPQDNAVIRLRLHSADTVTVRIMNLSGELVRVVAEGRRLPRGRTQLEWDGSDDAGGRAPDGRYRVEVHLAGPDRTFTLPQTVTLDTHEPTARLVSFRPEAAEVGQRVRVSYRVSEPAHGVLFVNGRRRVVTYTRNRVAELDWTPRRTGSFRLQLAARDLAGNLGPLTPVFVVRAG